MAFLDGESLNLWSDKFFHGSKMRAIDSPSRKATKPRLRENTSKVENFVKNFKLTTEKQTPSQSTQNILQKFLTQK
jgi:hypothetical protein